MPYYIDLSSISIEEYARKLENGYLPPSRMILKEKLHERFVFFKTVGMNNLKELQQKLKTKGSKNDLIKPGLTDENYLKILLREINSIHPKPNKIKDFPGINPGTITKLENSGIGNTLQVYDKVQTSEDREDLAVNTGIDYKEIMEITKLADLSRIKWVGATFARMLHDAGFDTPKKTSDADPFTLHRSIEIINKTGGYYKGQIGLNDIRILIEAAREVPSEIHYE